jgi:Rps23 Pro-64 3,4-dihydroxylase Tpa1-like proline 4-hydroxylase
MKIERLPEPFDCLVVFDTYNEDELKNIWKEIDFLSNEEILLSPEDTGSAKNENGENIKNNHGIWLHSFYKNNSASYIHSLFPKKFFSQEVFDALTSLDPMNNQYASIDHHTTLFNYYGEGSYYDFHVDRSIYTIITCFYREPKEFLGGEITFQFNQDSAYEQPMENNMSIIFPSFYYHKVSPITLSEKNNKWSGRYSVAHFLNISV